MKHVRNLMLIVGVPLVCIALVMAYFRWRPGADAFRSAHTGLPLTDDECIVYGKEVEAALRAGDKARFNDLLRVDKIQLRLEVALGLDPVLRRRLTGSHFKFTEPYLKNVANGGRFVFLHLHPHEEKTAALFRYHQADGNVTYVLIIPARHPDGQISADDIYLMNVGSTLSAYKRRELLQLASIQDAGALDRLSESDRQYVAASKVIPEMLADYHAGRFAEAHERYQQLPATIRKEKEIQLVGISILRNLDADLWLQALEELRKDFPDDAATDQLAYNYFLLKKDYPNAHRSLDRLDQRVGGDPYIHFLRGSLLQEEGRLADARAALEKANKECPGYAEILWARVNVSIAEQNDNDTRDWLKTMVIACDTAIDEATLRQNADFGRFLDSPQYQELIRWHAERVKRGGER